MAKLEGICMDHKRNILTVKKYPFIKQKIVIGKIVFKHRKKGLKNQSFLMLSFTYSIDG